MKDLIVKRNGMKYRWAFSALLVTLTVFAYGTRRTNMARERPPPVQEPLSVQVDVLVQGVVLNRPASAERILIGVDQLPHVIPKAGEQVGDAYIGLVMGVTNNTDVPVRFSKLGLWQSVFSSLRITCEDGSEVGLASSLRGEGEEEFQDFVLPHQTVPVRVVLTSTRLANGLADPPAKVGQGAQLKYRTNGSISFVNEGHPESNTLEGKFNSKGTVRIERLVPEP